MSSSSSDSEEEDEKRKLKEALDPCFLNVAKLSSSCGGVEINGEPTEVPASKRIKLQDDSTSDAYMKPYSLDVTPECQSFIAKQLGKSLDKNIKEVKPHTKISSDHQETVSDTGIKLFATSSVYLTDKDLQQISERQVKPKRMNGSKHKKKSKNVKGKPSSDSSSDSEEEKLKSAAVSADWIFNNPYS